jgi:uncharacterized repeat protein (TIGR03847 family)
MDRQVHIFRSPDRFLVGTVGRPGEREFYLQAVDGKRVVSVACEKQQVAVLADKLGSLIGEVVRRFGEKEPTVDPTEPSLETPVDPEFRVGTMGLAWDGDGSRIVVELLAITEAEVNEDTVLDDSADGPDALRVFLSLDEAMSFAAQAGRVVSSGRPPCPLCGNPLDPEGHICPRLNGYHRGDLG